MEFACVGVAVDDVQIGFGQSRLDVADWAREVWEPIYHGFKQIFGGGISGEALLHDNMSPEYDSLLT